MVLEGISARLLCHILGGEGWGRGGVISGCMGRGGEGLTIQRLVRIPGPTGEGDFCKNSCIWAAGGNKVVVFFPPRGWEKTLESKKLGIVEMLHGPTDQSAPTGLQWRAGWHLSATANSNFMQGQTCLLL